MKNKFTNSQKNAILGMFFVGTPIQHIADEMDCTRRSIYLWVNRFLETNDILRKKGTGIKRKTTPQEDTQILQLVDENPFISLSQIKTKLNLITCRYTISKRLKEAGLKSYSAREKSFLNDDKKVLRLEFCLKHKDWTNDQWKNVFFSDETLIQMGPNIKKRVWRKRGEAFEKKFISTVERRPPYKIQVWGCISGHSGLGIIHRVDGNMNQDIYSHIIENVMLPYAQSTNKDFIFQHDQSSIHMSSHVKQTLERLQIKMLKWPVKGADLNPIENVWALLKAKIDYASAPNANELWKQIQITWKKISETNLHAKLSDSMVTRIQNCINVNGDWTKY